MPAAASIRDYVLPYAGASESARVPVLTTNRILSDINSVLQQLFSGGQMENKSLLIRAPGTITLDAVTAESTAVTFAGYQSYMQGCTILISGDSRENRLVRSSGTLALESPYLGSTGTNVTAAIHYDCATVDVSIGKIYEPMSLDRKWELEMVDPALIAEVRFGLDRRQIARPMRAAIESALDSSSTPSRRILFDTLPDAAYMLHFRADVRAPVVTSFADTREFLLPNGLDHSVLKPLVLMAFSSHPSFTGDLGKIAPAAQVAQELWANSRGQGLARRQVSLMD